MNHPTRALVTATFSLLSVLSAHAANIKISSLPFNITAPGTYALTGNLSYTSGSSFGAISIIGPIEGPVVIDLKGFTITGDVGTDNNACISFSGSSGLYPITIRNGTITKFVEGVLANSISNITVNKVVFDQN